MLKSHERFHSSNGKRLILVADDEFVNRELMGLILRDEYELIFASDGREALELMRENKETLSLVLLDLMMPVMSGTEVLREVKKDLSLRQIPIIVITGDQEAEVESLGNGASDFIPKPFPKAEVIKARVLRIIELSEDREIIQSTERDPLTGLYNREFFYRYAEQYDQHHRDLEMDAIVVDINHFHMVNERFGTAYGDEVLRKIGERVLAMVRDKDGMVCRREADTFMVYCPHGMDYKAILENAAIGLTEDDSANNRVRLRMGVYARVDRSLDIQRRFDRAKMAADTVRNSFAKTIGFYDDTMHERELYAEHLIEDFPRAIAEKQFKVFYQPKFDVRPEIPVLASAEALVRWMHPTLGMISPGVFIPLFEDNGLIQTLDHYVWRTAAAQIHDWKNRLGFAVPVSVNVSRIDMYDPNLIDTFREILAENGLTADELLLEITESAYTQDSEQIIGAVNRLRELGFHIEMDDFGTGYSSLNMISTLPIDALKLDMQFIRNAFNQRKGTRMLEVIIDIADYLSVPVIAEGVETEEQLNALKAMGCDLVQGYYFSRPVPAEEYEKFVIERKDRDAACPETERKRGEAGGSYDAGFGRIAFALSSGFESVYYVDTENDRYVEFSSEGKYEDLQIRRSGADFFSDTQRNIPRVVFGEDQARVSACMEKEALLSQLADGRPYSLTYRLVIGASPVYYNLKAVKANTHDDHHVVIGVSNVNAEMRRLQETLSYSSIARALAADYFCIYYVDTETDRFVEYSANDDYRMFGFETEGEDFFNLSRSNMQRIGYPEDMDDFLASFTKENILKAKETSGVFTLTYRLMFGDKPTYVHMKASCMEDKNDPHIVIGVSNIDEQINREQEHASVLRSARELANRDPLTGVKSKHAYVEAETFLDQSIGRGSSGPFAVAVCDVNELKQVNDTLGHAAGDELIRGASRVICGVFAHSPVFRYGGDEFAVILSGGDYERRVELQEQLAQASRRNQENGGPVIACGIAAFEAGDGAVAEVFARADAAMYENKKKLKSVS